MWKEEGIPGWEKIVSSDEWVAGGRHSQGPRTRSSYLEQGVGSEV